MDDKQQEIIDELRRVAKLLNVNSLAEREFSQNSRLPVTTIRGRFGSWNRAIEAAGLIPNTPRLTHGKPVLTDSQLLQEIIRLASELHKTPTESEMQAFGGYSIKPYRARWGKFSEAVKIAYAEYGIPSGTEVTSSPPTPTNRKANAPSPQFSPNVFPKTYGQRKKTEYGEPINFRGLRHAPIVEQGVVYLFGMVSRELGFIIESVGIPYPDCVGKRCIDQKRQRWVEVRIEFEFKSKNFLEHGHNPEECDLIVCWTHDWDDCPLEVLELSSVINTLPNT
ncbi:MAG: hypothetical protein ABI835_15380 [Chloroflexota bacterium]